MNIVKPNISVVVVTWNSEKDISDCLTSINNQTYKNIDKVIVVDNLSSDSTVKVIKENFPEIELIESEQNTYFTGGHNIGIHHAIKKYNSDYIAILNPDTFVMPDWIETMVKNTIKDDKIGISGSKVKFWHNENEGKINSAGLVYDGFMQAYDNGFMDDDNGQYDYIKEVDAVTGCCMLLKKEMIVEIGAFWEPLKMYLEDLEFCIRAKKKGWKILYVGSTHVGHKWMQSTSKNKKIKLDRWKNRNWFLIATRHYNLRKKLAVYKNLLLNA
ncbi:glycosyltransferase family 2 protein [Candidatus Dojkabacteria bacterium]|uniref:Glycosyltransferase family 2 protein n=1 Tax=Candidatus Dojkabacteria bacterium TaxID=2099670 RepID=A0A955RLL2_9BACT|nr:glycosyltransferase family 2 protein [Candidatus Dojkabacteria bacterium]